MHQVKRVAVITSGTILVVLGLIFIFVPGPAILFLPLGLALLSMEYAWAKRYLKLCQRFMRKSAVQLDKWISDFKRR